MIRGWISTPFPLPEENEEDFAGWWSQSRLVFQMRYRKAFDSLVVMVCWFIWKERDARILEHSSKTVEQIYSAIREEILTWREAGIFERVD